MARFRQRAPVHLWVFWESAASAEGTDIRSLKPDEAAAINDGMSIAEVVLQKTRPDKVEQLVFW